MLDADIYANAIDIVRTKLTITSMQLSEDLNIHQYKAKEILEQLEECALVVHFDGFYACTDWAELN